MAVGTLANGSGVWVVVGVAVGGGGVAVDGTAVFTGMKGRNRLGLVSSTKPINAIMVIKNARLGITIHVLI